jgi:hypothetical protein
VECWSGLGLVTLMSYVANPICLQRRVPLFLGCPRGLGAMIDPRVLNAAAGNVASTGAKATTDVALAVVEAPFSWLSNLFQNATDTTTTSQQLQDRIAQEKASIIAAGGDPATAGVQAQADQVAIATQTSQPGAFPSVPSVLGLPSANELALGTPIPTWAWILLLVGGVIVITDLL